MKKVQFVALACAVAISAFFAPRIFNALLESDFDNPVADTTPLSESEEEDPAAEVGDCLPAGVIDTRRRIESLALDCEDPEAYWKIFAIDLTVEAELGPKGGLDPIHFEDSCGPGSLRPRTGGPITHVVWFWNQDPRIVESFYCLEVLNREEPDGTILRYPDVGDCITKATETIACGKASAFAEVVSVEELDAGSDLTEAELMGKGDEDCPGFWTHWEYDHLGEAALFYCTDRL